ncbi:ATP6V1F [Cordylochernes scorpioides]|uniref:V-type proton ATPase subunit F n=1 Tax=Cordylochernes scorpioides TaxID=51811 RepID=A0ABY6LND5_9ARAC|nr:ATP6V1F [Cordylochernes scorpioides]
MTAHSASRGKLIAVIGDEASQYLPGCHPGMLLQDTCVGFLLGGIGELDKSRQPNFLVVDKNTSAMDIEECFKNFVNRDDIDIILINQNIAEMIRHLIDGHTKPTPAILEIPSKDQPYDPSKDSILRRAKVSWVFFLHSCCSSLIFLLV